MKLQIDALLMIISQLFQGDPLYVQFWERVQDQREDMVFNSIQEGLDLLLGETQVKYY